MKKTLCEFITPTGAVNVRPAAGKFKLAEMQEAVAGYVEVVTLSDQLILLVNEDGATKRLPVNRLAMARIREIIQREPVTIFGNAIICDRELVMDSEAS